MKKKSVKNNKDKNSFKNYIKGFTLVELLAVIVILAIIMIIAIPSVLNTMRTAQSEAFIEYANKLMNKAEEVYLHNQLMGVSYPHPSSTTYIMFDIEKDLGLNNTGDYFGVAFLRLYKSPKTGEERIDKGVYLFNDEYYTMYNSIDYGQLSKEHILNVNDFKTLINERSLKDLDFKKILTYYILNRNCAYYSDSVVDGVNGEYFGGCYNKSKHLKNYINAS